MSTVGPIQLDIPRRHRYERAQGFPITKYRVTCHDMHDGVERVAYVFGAMPTYVWDSYESPDWHGPRFVVLFFAGVPPSNHRAALTTG